MKELVFNWRNVLRRMLASVCNVCVCPFKWEPLHNCLIMWMNPLLWTINADQCAFFQYFIVLNLFDSNPFTHNITTTLRRPCLWKTSRYERTMAEPWYKRSKRFKCYTCAWLAAVFHSFTSEWGYCIYTNVVAFSVATRAICCVLLRRLFRPHLSEVGQSAADSGDDKLSVALESAAPRIDHSLTGGETRALG